MQRMAATGLLACLGLLLTQAPAEAFLGLGGGKSSSEDFRAVIQRAQEKVFPALVFIKPIKQQLASGERTRRRIFGSGVIITPEGLVVTNSHVARDATDIKCVLYSREQLSAHVVGFDEHIDLALIQLELPEGHAVLPSVSLGDSDKLNEGQFVMALGSPFGFSRSISFGIISSTRRYLSSGYYHLWLQTDAAINPGNSGGPLVNDEGAVIGINTLKASRGENIGFAIPSNTVREIVAHLIQHGRVIRSYSGLQFQPVKDFLRDTLLDYDTGVLVAGVDEGSPAAEAGLKSGDLILRCNDQPLYGIYLEDLPQIRSYFAFLQADQPVALLVQRGAQRLPIALTPAEKPSEMEEGLELEMWNCSMQQITQFRTPELAYFVPRGVYVLGTREPGNAHISGLRAGDIVVQIDGETMYSLTDVQKAYRQLSRLDRGKRTALLKVLREGYAHNIVLDFNRDHKSFK